MVDFKVVQQHKNFKSSITPPVDVRLDLKFLIIRHAPLLS